MSGADGAAGGSGGRPASGGSRASGATGSPDGFRRPDGVFGRGLLIGGAVVGALALVAGALFAGAATGAQVPVAAPTSSTPVPEPEPTRVAPSEEPAASRLRTCSVEQAVSDARLADAFAYVVNAETGEALLDRQGTTPVRTGSVLKVLTAAAALATLGPDVRLETTTVDTGDGVAIVGGGDPTISRLPTGQASYYPGSAHLDALASDTLAAWAAAHPGEQIERIVVDATLWDASDRWLDSWARSEQTIGYMSEVTALQVDGDRADPTQGTSPRSTEPVQRAGDFFAQALVAADTRDLLAPDVQVVAGDSGGGAQLAVAQSAPVRELVTQMLRDSENTIAESLARLVSLERGGDGSAASLQEHVVGALTGYGVDTAGITIIDGSGLSEFNAVPPSYVATLMRQVNDRAAGLGVIDDALPIAGQTGTLRTRFTGDNAVAVGRVRAKTGWIDTAYSLAGVVEAQDGTTLVFAFFAVGDVSDSARAALDTLATSVWRCGDNLSNL